MFRLLPNLTRLFSGLNGVFLLSCVPELFWTIHRIVRQRRLIFLQQEFFLAGRALSSKRLTWTFLKDGSGCPTPRLGLPFSRPVSSICSLTPEPLAGLSSVGSKLGFCAKVFACGSAFLTSFPLPSNSLYEARTPVLSNDVLPASPVPIFPRRLARREKITRPLSLFRPSKFRFVDRTKGFKGPPFDPCRSPGLLQQRLSRTLSLLYLLLRQYESSGTAADLDFRLLP